MTAAYFDYYAGRRVMITGGLGFIGSNVGAEIDELTCWAPRVGLREGLRRTVDFYRHHVTEYVDSPGLEAQARL